MLSTEGNMEKRAGVAATTSHPSSTGLLNAHVIFKWNRVDVGTKEAKGRVVWQTAHSLSYL